MPTGTPPSLVQIKRILRRLFNHRQHGTSRPDVHISISTSPSPPEPRGYLFSPPSCQSERVHGPELQPRYMPFICGPDSVPDSPSMSSVSIDTSSSGVDLPSISTISIDTSSSGVNSPISLRSPLKRSAEKPPSKAKIRRLLTDLYNRCRLGISHRDDHICISQTDDGSSPSGQSVVCDRDYLTPPMPLPQNERIHGPEPQFLRMPFCSPDSEPSSPPISPISNDGPISRSRSLVSPLSHLERLAASWRKHLIIPQHRNLGPSAASTTATLNLPLSPSSSRRLSLASSTGSQVSFVSALEYPAAAVPQFATKQSVYSPYTERSPCAASSTTAMSDSPLPSSSNLIPSLKSSIQPSVIPSSPVQRPAVPSPQPAVMESRCFPNPYSRPSSDASIKTMWNFPPPSRRASLVDCPNVRPSSGASAASQRPRDISPMRPPLPSVRSAASGPDFPVQEPRFAKPRSSARAASSTAMFGYPLERWPRRGSSLEYFSSTSPTSDAPGSRSRYPIVPVSPIIRPSAPSPESAMRGGRLPNPRLSANTASTKANSHLPPSPSPNLDTIPSPPVTPPTTPSPQPPRPAIILFIRHNDAHTFITITLPTSLQHLWTQALTRLRLWDGTERVRRGRMMVRWRGRGMYWDGLPERTVITEVNIGWVLGTIRERRGVDVVEVVLFWWVGVWDGEWFGLGLSFSFVVRAAQWFGQTCNVLLLLLFFFFLPLCSSSTMLRFLS